MMENHLPIMSEKKQHFFQHKKKQKYQRILYRQVKEHRKMVDFAAVFKDITRRRTLSEEAPIPTSKMTTIKICYVKYF